MPLKTITKQKIRYKELLVVLLCIMTVLFYVFLDDEKKQVKVAAMVNEDPVIIYELRHWMLLNKSNVYNHFYQTYEASYNASFWATPVDGKTPLKILKQRSLKDAVRWKVQQQLAKELDIQVTMNYRELMEERLKVNKIRKKRVEKGEIIYGPVTFTPRTYLSRVHDKLVLKSKHILLDSRFKISKNKIEMLYEEYQTNRETLAAEGVKLDIASFEQFKAVRQNQHTEKKYEQLIDKLVTEAKIKLNKPVYNKITLE